MPSERYNIEALAGQGGMGAVYRARDAETGRTVALKVLAPEYRRQHEWLRREAHLLSQLNHPHVVRYLGHGETERGELYLVLEWLEGESLSRRIKRGPLSVEETVALGRKVAEALAAVHAEGIIHRDV